MTPVRALLDRLIDYAGLFPPAALEMSAAVRQYAACRRGPHAWALGRFIVPLARLPEMQQAMRQAAAPIAEAGDWKLSVLALPGEPLPPGIDSVEMKIERAEDIRRLSSHSPALRYFEIPIAADPRELVAALAETGGRAKVRTGGLTPEAYPGVAELARCLCACAAARVPFKATAGLHHPLPGPKGAPPMHGFVNLFLAAALAYHGGAGQDVAAAPAHHGGTRWDVEATLQETSAEAFRWDADGVSWHGHRLSTAQIAAARAEFAISFGSCSFEEPIAGLEALGWL
ncbi:MAG: hypothetical protein ACLQU1_18965 [Bryobacteraceae bacterium]